MGSKIHLIHHLEADELYRLYKDAMERTHRGGHAGEQARKSQLAHEYSPRMLISAAFIVSLEDKWERISGHVLQKDEIADQGKIPNRKYFVLLSR
jgi:hypothetical protein